MTFDENLGQMADDDRFAMLFAGTRSPEQGCRHSETKGAAHKPDAKTSDFSEGVPPLKHQSPDDDAGSEDRRDQ